MNTGGSWSDLHYKKKVSFGQVEDKRRWVMWRSLLSKQEHLYLDFLPKIIHPAVGVGKARAAVSTLPSGSRLFFVPAAPT